MEERMIRLEIDVENMQRTVKELRSEHKEEMQSLRSAMKDVQQGFNEILTLVRSIKWWLIGVGSFVVVEQVGIVGVIRKVIGL